MEQIVQESGLRLIIWLVSTDQSPQYLCVVVLDSDDDAQLMEEHCISLNINLAACWLKLCA